MQRLFFMSSHCDAEDVRAKRTRALSESAVVFPPPRSVQGCSPRDSFFYELVLGLMATVPGASASPPGTTADGAGADSTGAPEYKPSRGVQVLANPVEYNAAFDLMVEGKMPSFHEIVPGLFLGDQTAAGIVPPFERTAEGQAATRRTLKDRGIDHIVVCADGSEAYSGDVTYHHVPLGDVSSAKNENVLVESLPKTIRFIDAVVGAGGGCLVHCNAGISRSASVVCAYLMRSRLVRFEDAYLLVVSKRPIASPGFDEVLIRHERALMDPAVPLEALVKVHARSESGAVDDGGDADASASDAGPARANAGEARGAGAGGSLGALGGPTDDGSGTP